jgi:hypothetical protein
LEKLTADMKPYLLLLIVLAFSTADFPQQYNRRARLEDSLVNESKWMAGVVDSLRKRAMHQDTIIESMDRLVHVLSAAKARDTTELHNWRKTYDYEMRRFDSTLERLDTCTGLLNALSNKLDSLLKKP